MMFFNESDNNKKLFLLSHQKENLCVITVFKVSVISNSTSLTHGGDGVGGGSLMVGEPQSRQLSGCEDDEGLSQRTEGLTHHH